MVRLRAFGVFAIQIADSRVFINQIAGTMGLYTDADIAGYLKNLLVSKLTEVLGAQAKTVTALPALFGAISEAVKTALQSDFQNMGLLLHEYIIGSISLPEEVQAMIDQRTGMSAIGNMDDFMKFKMAMSMEEAAKNPGNTAGQGMGAGLGLGMGFMMPQVVQQMMPNSTVPKDDRPAVEKLKDLKGLLDQSIITQAEFDQKKAQLLNLI
jgi:membrane protease subunit (stomatin/prohibitin family)